MDATLERRSPRQCFPYLHGIYLVANAVADLRLLVDGPDCSFFRAQHVFGAHDLRSTLLDVGGVHRVLHTGLHPDTVAGGHDDRLAALVGRALTTPGAALLLVAALPMAAITGVDYEGLVREAAAEAATDGPVAPVMLLPRRSLEADWLDGWADTLAEIAATLPLPPARPREGTVAVVGHLLDRNEEDQRGNARELRRLLTAGLGLEVVSVWLEGGPVSELTRVAEAETVLGLPHAERAAATLAERTGARLVGTELPFGLGATDRFLRAVGDATDRASRAEGFIADQRAEIDRRWEWLVPRRLLHRAVGIEADPYLLPGFCELARLVGMRVGHVVAHGRERPELAIPDVGVRWEPPLGARPGVRTELLPPLDLLITNALGASRRDADGTRVPTLELGYPSRAYHASFDAPFLGYRGALRFVDRLANALGDRALYI